MASATLCACFHSDVRRHDIGRIFTSTKFMVKPRAALIQSGPRELVLSGGAKNGGSLASSSNNGNSRSKDIVRRLERSLESRSSSHDDPEAEARAEGRAANASAYDPTKIAEKYRWKPLKLDQNKRTRARELRKIFTRLGPTFVKVGQGLSTRPDLCPPEYLEELSELQDALPTFPNADAFACIERELELSLDSIFSAISASPIAAASLGQVYKARLRYSGQLVAVKVQRPEIEEAIGLDFYLVRGLGKLINEYVDVITSDVVALVDEFARRVYQELNYVQEAKNAIRFKKLYGDRPDVLVPEIFWDYTSVKVLTMDWIDGVKLNEHEAIQSQGLKLIDMVNIGIQCSLRQLLEHGYFHADPHPGNLLATADGKLAFLDF